MKITAKRKDLLSAAKLALATADTKSPISFYSQTLVVRTTSGLTISATDGAVSVSTAVKGDGDKGKIAFAVDSRKFFDVISLSHGEDISLDADAGKVVITAGKSRITVPIIKGDDYPAMRAISSGRRDVMASGLLAAIRKTAFIADVGADTRVPATVRMSCDGKRMSLVAIVSHRVAQCSFSCASGAFDEVSLTRKGAEQIASVLDRDGSEIAELFVSKDGVSVSYGAISASASSVEAAPVPWQNLLTDDGQRVVVPREELSAAVDRAALFTTKDHQNVKLSVDELVLTVSRDGNLGDATSHIDLANSHEQCSVMLNGKYISDAMAAIHTDSVELQLIGSLSPVMFRPTDGSDQVLVIAAMNDK